MNTYFLWRFRKRQEEFRKQVAAVRWQKQLTKIKTWQKRCNKRTCTRCGGDTKASRQKQCKCYHGVYRPNTRALIRLLRRMAGINGGHASSKNEWVDWNNGKRGPRGCGPPSWDNVVRLYEDGY